MHRRGVSMFLEKSKSMYNNRSERRPGKVMHRSVTCKAVGSRAGERVNRNAGGSGTSGVEGSTVPESEYQVVFMGGEERAWYHKVSEDRIHNIPCTGMSIEPATAENWVRKACRLARVVTSIVRSTMMQR